MNDTMQNRSFCFVLGAGASVTSAIKPAGKMVNDWIETIYCETTNYSGAVPADWATAQTLGIETFDPADSASSYSALYRRMYENDPDAGFAYLEEQMKDAEPSFGYSVLGRILAETRHRVVITVNFDNLVADSVSLFSKTYPLVCGHELLAPFVTDKLRRPLVLKVHRDLLLSPMSTPEEIQKIDEGFSDAIGRLLRNYTPIVIGYGGNDGSLMQCLETLPENTIPGGIYWCYRDGSTVPARIRKVVAKHKGHLVGIMGFDELLMQFGNELAFDVPDQYVRDRAKERAERIVKQARELKKRLTKRNEEAQKLAAGAVETDKSVAAQKEVEAVTDAMSRTMQRQAGSKRWWQWDHEARAEPDTTKRDEIYKKAIKELPRSAELLGNYAVFLESVRKDFEAAEAMYKQAIEADPRDADYLGNYAAFLENVRKDPDAAEAMYKRAIKADPRHANSLGNYALFLENVRKDFDAAEAIYKQAIEADPRHANNLGNYALFLKSVRKDFEAAEAMYKQAIEADPRDAYYLGDYALFLENVRKDPGAAEAMYRQAIDADPRDANNVGNYAGFLLAAGRAEEGLAMLDQAFTNIVDGQSSQILEECSIYAYCCGPASTRSETLSRLKSLLSQSDVRTGDWDFSGVIAQAKKLNHPEAKWLPRLAKVLSGQAPLQTLDQWAAWKNAS